MWSIILGAQFSIYSSEIFAHFARIDQNSRHSRTLKSMSSHYRQEYFNKM